MRISDWSSDVCSSDLVRADDLVGRPGEQDLADLKVEGLLGIAAEKLTETIAAGGTEAILARRAMERLFVEYHRGSQACASNCGGSASTISASSASLCRSKGRSDERRVGKECV